MSVPKTPEADTKEARRIKRVALKFPVRVSGKDSAETDWHEITRIKDVSEFGASFSLARPVKRGRLIKLTMPMPRQLRSYDYLDPEYEVWGIVRRCIAANRSITNPTFLMGVVFIGKFPPKSYFDDPSQLFDLSLNQEDDKWHLTAAPEIPDESMIPEQDRRHSRYPIPINIVVEKIEDKKDIKGESSVTENISLGGACVFSTLDLDIGSFLKVRSEQYGVSIKSIVRGKRLGPDGIPRLHVEFIDRFFPLDGIEDPR